MDRSVLSETLRQATKIMVIRRAEKPPSPSAKKQYAMNLVGSSEPQHFARFTTDNGYRHYRR